MHSEYARLAIEALKAMYSHNSQANSVIGRTEVGPEPVNAEQVAKDLRIIYTELIKREED